MRNLQCHTAIAAGRAAADKAPGSRAEQSSLTQRSVRWHGTSDQARLKGFVVSQLTRSLAGTGDEIVALIGDQRSAGYVDAPTKPRWRAIAGGTAARSAS